ncbi:MAG: hypothetical protein H7840_15010 [Alphaproteobacteria bacterium]
MSDVRSDLDKITSLIATGRRLLAEGRLVDLSALEGMVKGTCADVATLPDEEARALMFDLQRLYADLEALESDLNAYRDRAPSAEQVTRAYVRSAEADEE